MSALQTLVRLCSQWLNSRQGAAQCHQTHSRDRDQETPLDGGFNMIRLILRWCVLDTRATPLQFAAPFPSPANGPEKRSVLLLSHPPRGTQQTGERQFLAMASSCLSPKVPSFPLPPTPYVPSDFCSKWGSTPPESSLALTLLCTTLRLLGKEVPLDCQKLDQKDAKEKKKWARVAWVTWHVPCPRLSAQW